MANTRPVLRIQQLEGSRLILELAGRAGPLEGASRPVRQRGEVTRAPGSNKGRALLLGGEDEPTDYDFKWRTRSLIGTRDAVVTDPGVVAVVTAIGGLGAAALAGGAIEDADDLVELVKKIVREPSICAISFRGLEAVGFLRSIDPIEGRLGEYEVALEVEWITPSLDRRPKPPPATSDPTDTYNDMVDSWIEYIRTALAPITMAVDKLESAEAAFGRVNSTLRMAGSVALEFERGFKAIKGVKRTMAGAIWAVGDAALDLKEAVQVGAAETAQSDEPVAVINALKYRAGAQGQAGRMERQSRIESMRLSDEADPDVLGVHIAVEGEDLRYVALRTYGDVSTWEDLAEYNQLTGTYLSGGTRVKLPQLTAFG